MNELVKADMRSQVIALEAAMREMPEQQIEIIPRHYFAQGLYAREITIPKGCVLTGKIHLFEHLNIISKGDISVMTEDGIRRLKAPCTLVSKPGMKRAGWAHEETVWTTIHACDVRDGDEAERLLVVDTFEEFERLVGGTPCLLLP